jgi:type I phosphodiesterase/nucleotide pyrophosphatase
MPSILWLGIVSLVGLLYGCATAPKAPGPPPPFGALISQRIDHVIIVAIDGLKEETLLAYLKRGGGKRKGGLHDLLGVHSDGSGIVLNKGVAVQQAVSVFPSFTYPSWTSMFTGVYPGAHGITGNNLFFRDRGIARYYTEYHLDALRAQVDKNFFSDDINQRTQTLHEYVNAAGGRSIVVHNMVTRGSLAVKPDFDTLWSYQRNHSEAVDENSLWEAVHALDVFSKSPELPKPVLPSVLTLYFAGLDHVEHVTWEGVGGKGAEEARLAYLDHLDNLIAKFFTGDPAVTRNHFENPASEPVRADPIAWPGIVDTPAWQHTLLVLASDHGHTPVRWVEALGFEDLKLVFKELSENRKLAYNLEQPSLINETMWSKVQALWGLVEEGEISKQANVVATLNGGTLGLHLKPRDGPWSQRPNYADDVKPVLEHLLLTLHVNGQGPEAVLYHTGNRYVVIPYNIAETGTGIQLLPPKEVEESSLNTASFPMAVERVNGLASNIAGDPSSAPDIILLADRSKQLTYANKQEWRVIEELKKDNHKHFHSDHGHLRAQESAVPIMFVLGSDPGTHAHATICQASLVDITPTILDTLGLLASFEADMAARPSNLRGHSLKNSIELILGDRTDGDNICPAPIP